MIIMDMKRLSDINVLWGTYILTGRNTGLISDIDLMAGIYSEDSTGKMRDIEDLFGKYKGRGVYEQFILDFNTRDYVWKPVEINLESSYQIDDRVIVLKSHNLEKVLVKLWDADTSEIIVDGWTVYHPSMFEDVLKGFDTYAVKDGVRKKVILHLEHEDADLQLQFVD